MLTLVLFVGMNLMSRSIWASERFDPAQPGALQVEVTGMQFAWYFRYAGPDGQFGAIKPELIDASEGGESAIGLDLSYPASKDYVVAGTMYVPGGPPSGIDFAGAQDVIHSFFIPSMRLNKTLCPAWRFTYLYTDCNRRL